MKYYILPCLVAFAITSCSADTSPPATSTPQRSAPIALAVDFTPAANQALKKNGFSLPSAKIKAPDFTLKDLSGQDRSLSSFRKKLVLINFWGAWCYYCREEMPSFQRFYDRFKNEGLEIVAVNVQDTEAEARNYINKNRYTFPVLLDATGSVTGMYGIRGFPTTFILDQDGYLRAMLVGGLDWDTPPVTALFKQLLSTP
jgi:peroxiredoxin